MQRFTELRTYTVTTIFVIFIFIMASSTYAFTDMNDSFSQAPAIDALQRRVDSLEVRLQKVELKKASDGWMTSRSNEGFFMSGQIKIPNGLDSPRLAFGYQFNLKRKDSTSYSLAPVICLEWENYSVEKDNYLPESNKPVISLGMVESSPILDRFSYSVGLYGCALLRCSQHHKGVIGGGGAFDAIVNMWVTEKFAINFGYFTYLFFNTNIFQEDDESTGNWAMYLNSNLIIGCTYHFGKSHKAGGTHP
jgi:hypothetical protein